MAIYVSTWGDPSRWKKATYKKQSKDIVGFSTIATYENAEKVIIIVQDSVLLPQSNNNDYAIECIRRYRDDGKKFPTNNYEEWVKIVEDYIKCVASKASNDNIKVIVVPALSKLNDKENKVGNFEFGKFELGGREIPSYIYAELLETLLVQKLYEELKNEEAKVILDITHGVNYLPVIAYHVLYNLTSLLGLDFEVINYIPTEYEKEYTYAEILREKDKKTLDLTQIDENKHDDIAKRLLVKSLKYNAPLLAIKMCKNGKSGVRDYYKDFLESVKIEDNTIKIRKKFEPDPAWVDVIYDYICENINANEGITTKEIKSFSDKILKKFSEVSTHLISIEIQNINNLLNQLNDGERKLYSEILKIKKKEEKERFMKIVENKVRELYFKVCKSANAEDINVSIDEMLSSELFRPEVEDERSSTTSENVLKRHFIAHAGLLKDYVIIERRGNKLYVDYDESKCKELIEKVLKEEKLDPNFKC